MDVKAAILNERELVLCLLPSCFVSGARPNLSVSFTPDSNSSSKLCG